MRAGVQGWLSLAASREESRYRRRACEETGREPVRLPGAPARGRLSSVGAGDSLVQTLPFISPGKGRGSPWVPGDSESAFPFSRHPAIPAHGETSWNSPAEPRRDFRVSSIYFRSLRVMKCSPQPL